LGILDERDEKILICSRFKKADWTLGQKGRKEGKGKKAGNMKGEGEKKDFTSSNIGESSASKVYTWLRV